MKSGRSALRADSERSIRLSLRRGSISFRKERMNPYDSGRQWDKHVETHAYFLWNRAGRPPGDGREFWWEAERQLLQERPAQNSAQPGKPVLPAPIQKARRMRPLLSAAPPVKKSSKRPAPLRSGEKSVKGRKNSKKRIKESKSQKN